MYQQQAQSRISVAKLLLMESGTYSPQYSRPYQTHIDGVTMESLVRRMDQSGGKPITGSLLAGVASSILKPTAAAGGEIPIHMGWTERRIRFFMEVHVTLGSGTEMIYYFQGYTSHLGVGNNGAVDPRMEFIMNSYVRVTRGYQHTPYGVQVRDVVTESAHIVNGNIVQQVQGGAVYGMRPQDIFTGIQSAYLSNAYNHYHATDVLNDTRIRFNGESVRSNRANNLPSNFIAKVVDSYQTGVQLSEFGQSEQDIMSRCHDLTHEASAYENVFIRALSNVRGVQCSTTFHYEDLRRIDPNIDNVTNYITLGSTSAVQLHQAGQTAYWNGADNETLAATVLSNAIPAVMMELMISKIHFRSTNHDQTGTMNTVIINANSLTSADMSANYELFKRRIEREILLDITYGGQELYMLEMRADLFGDTTISISIGNGPMTTYTTPSFCDSLLTPVMTMSRDNFFSVVNDFEQMMNNINSSKPKSNLVNSLV